METYHMPTNKIPNCLILSLSLLCTPLCFLTIADAQMPSVVKPDSSRNSVKIISISPEITKPLYVGDTVNFEVKADYKITKAPATLGLVIQKGEMTAEDIMNVVIASSTEVLNDMEGSVTLKQSIVVPDTRAVQIFTPIIISGQDMTSIADMKTYQVLKK